ncbi:response regulator transcription factor [Salipaludibacillus agaradhaerens]|uniref:response regulator transcription factor n=1 Tax=Salipaludibacillus agaradhaerens TaxID=76935 RepID=UPI0009983CDD|nr:response regulator transcription factor [Salipaludibacillus agaradhaerens]MCR6105614.1 response regulator transcription factor [Salipaludibacillus agaradhaerens]MCR6117651.1 response regulator transcription factor [Salipaludibacillus agaradhaerens]UJW56835.1 response regulator transcription factor [Bacillus sp. A116_S68]
MIKIVLAEDQQMLRGALGLLLNLEKDMDVVGQASDGEEALSLIHKLNPDVCLLDIEMPLKSGLQVAESLKRDGHPCKVIILTTFARPGYFERAIEADVFGYLLKDGPSEELAEAIRNVMKGKREIAPELVFVQSKQKNPLTDREQEILTCVREGKTVKEISKTLYLSNGTVRNYISEAIAKLETKNRMEAVKVAEEKGWI